MGEILSLLSRALSAENRIAMWKAPKTANDVAVLLGVAKAFHEVVTYGRRCTASECRARGNTSLLRIDILSMLQG